MTKLIMQYFMWKDEYLNIIIQSFITQNELTINNNKHNINNKINNKIGILL